MKIEALTVQEALRAARSRLSAVSEHPALDAQTLLAGLTGRSRAWLMAHPEADLPPQEAEFVTKAILLLENGEPLPYILGEWEFFGLRFAVTPAVLIPRPETELIVEQALAWLQEHPERRRGADVGTGSGCIAVSLAVHCAGLEVAATDVSVEALRVAEQNARRHGVEASVRLVAGDLLERVEGPVDLICANLPYIPTETLRGLGVSRREPVLALDGGPDGLRLIRRLLRQAGGKLAEGGLLLCEIEAGQGEAALRLAREAFPKAGVRVLKDLADLDRLVRIEAGTENSGSDS